MTDPFSLYKCPKCDKPALKITEAHGDRRYRCRNGHEFQSDPPPVIGTWRPQSNAPRKP